MNQVNTPVSEKQVDSKESSQKTESPQSNGKKPKGTTQKKTKTGSPAKGAAKPNRDSVHATQTGRDVKFDPANRHFDFISKMSADSGTHVRVMSRIVIPKELFTERQLQVVISLCKAVNHFTLGHDVNKDVVSPQSTDKDGKVIPAKVTPSRIKKLSARIDAAVVKTTDDKASNAD